jgi:hypothetical protein
MEAPKPNIQAPEKVQAPSPQLDVWALEFEALAMLNFKS